MRKNSGHWPRDTNRVAFSSERGRRSPTAGVFRPWTRQNEPPEQCSSPSLLWGEPPGLAFWVLPSLVLTKPPPVLAGRIFQREGSHHGQLSLEAFTNYSADQDPPPWPTLHCHNCLLSAMGCISICCMIRRFQRACATI